MNIEELKAIPIAKVLASFNISPSRATGNDLWYFAWTREEKTASVSVNTKLNRFYDHGTKHHGSVIDVITELKGFRVKEALEYLASFEFGQVDFKMPIKDKCQIENVISDKLQICRVEGINHPALLSFSKSRGINQSVLRSFCLEVHYEVSAKMYFAIGFKNDKGGFELRNKLFKNCSSPKTITTIKNGSSDLIVFEGFFDFLSYLTLKPQCETKYDFIILNSVSNVDLVSSEILNSYRMIFLFLDNDNAGRNTVEILKEKSENIYDFSNKYKDFNDLNDYLLFKMKINANKNSNNEE